jgi:hypothetical protein
MGAVNVKFVKGKPVRKGGERALLNSRGCRGAVDVEVNLLEKVD